MILAGVCCVVVWACGCGVTCVFVCLRCLFVVRRSFSVALWHLVVWVNVFCGVVSVS